ncbi:MAG: phosphopantothenoylcysteine decarboxylase domain-containing protein [Candidatus Dormibacteria bacterium]
MAASLAGRRVVVSAGGTREPIDAVRYIGNRSSGRMGNALVLEALRRDARVVLVTTVEAPAADPRLEVLEVETAAEMDAAVRGALPGSDVLVMAAAVADYRAAHAAAGKIKKTSVLHLELVSTVDILRSLRDAPERRGVLIVGFAAETDDIESNARAKLRDKGLDLIVVNDVGRPGIGMGSDHNAVTILAPDGGRWDVPRRPKAEVAVAVWDVVTSRLR